MKVINKRPDYRFFFGYVTWTEGEALNINGEEAGWADGGYSTDYIDIKYLHSFKTSYVAACSGVFYDDRQQVLDYFGYTPGKAYNCTATGIVTVPKKARYIRVNMPTLQRTDGTAYVGTEDGKDNWIEWRAARPNHGDLHKVWEMGSDQRFYRATLTDKLTFIKNDYHYITTAAFDKVFHVVIEQSNDRGKTWFRYYHGKFSMTDAEVDMFRRQIEVSLTTVDAYDALLAGWENEYNLVELAPEIERVKYTKRPLVQLYVAGEDIVTCLLGGMYWEQSAERVDSENEIFGYRFSYITTAGQVKITGIGSASGDPNHFNGYYVGRVKDNKAIMTKMGDPTKTVVYVINPDSYGYTLLDNGKVAYSSGVSHVSIENIAPYLILNAQSGYTGQYRMEAMVGRIYGRILFDKVVDGSYTIPTEDIVENNRNYRYCKGYDLITITTTSDASQEPTQWGRRPDNLYYVEPPSSVEAGNGGLWAPIGQSKWGDYYSMWVQQNDWITESIEEQYRAPDTLRDAYPLWSCIDVLLRAIAPSIRHKGTAEYSNFLYGSTPIKNEPWRLYVTQNTKIKHGYYSQAAQRAPITLKQVFEMLRDSLRCYWFIEGNKLRIEHIEYFRNGGSYNPADHKIGFDLSVMIYSRNGKPQSFGQKQYWFDRDELPERYEFGWSQATTTPFSGYPMEILSKYVKAGKVERVTVDSFLTDIDYALLNPGDVSDDGLMLLGVTPNEDTDPDAPKWEVPIVTKDYAISDHPMVRYTMQNGYLSFVHLVPTYYIYDMPASRALINTQEYRYGASCGMSIKGMKRIKRQEVTFASIDDPTLTRLLRTGIGDGEIIKVRINVEYRTTDATVALDAE